MTNQEIKQKISELQQEIHSLRCKCQHTFSFNTCYNCGYYDLYRWTSVSILCQVPDIYKTPTEFGDQ